MKFSKIPEFLTYLYSLPRMHDKADLTPVLQILAVLDHPEKKFKSIHVTGTNGKGSTAYFAARLLQEAGHRTGLFVSPYVQKFNERIQINNQQIPDAELLRLAQQVEAAIAQLRTKIPTFSLVTFEYEVVLAFLYFSQNDCEYAIIEAGIGARHDKTNVILPEVSIITSVGLDHVNLIGPSLLDIAYEKSGIIKWQRPVVIGQVSKDVLEVLLEQANKMQSKVSLLGQDFAIQRQRGKTHYLSASATFDFKSLVDVEAFDAAMAISAISQVIDLTQAIVKRAIDRISIPGRYQVVQHKPLVIADGAHNPQAINHLLDNLNIQAAKRHGRVFLIIAMMKDKDLDQVFDQFTHNEIVTLTTIDYPRAAKKSDFPVQIAEKYPYQPDFWQAYQQILAKMRPNDILAITGSFYLVGEFLNRLEGSNNVDD